MPPIAAIATVDVVVFVVAGLMAVRGISKGFAWQVVRTAGLGGSLYAATLWHEPVGGWMGARLGFLPTAATPWIAWVLLLVALFLAATWVAWVCRGALRTLRLGEVDRFLGFFAGALLGFLLVTAGYLAWGSFARGDSIADALRGSVSGPWMARTVDALAPLVPEDQRTRWQGVLDTLDSAR